MDKKMASILALLGGIIGAVSYILDWIDLVIVSFTGLEILTDNPEINLDWIIVLVGLIGAIIVIIFAVLVLMDMEISLPLDNWLIILIGGILQIVTVIGVFVSESMFNLDFEFLLDFYGIGYFVLIFGAIISVVGGILLKPAAE